MEQWMMHDMTILYLRTYKQNINYKETVNTAKGKEW